jgi:ribosomal protein S18 acetylase RimI-like enzyme
VTSLDKQPEMTGLRRASTVDITRVTALQQAAYAGNRSILGVEPLPLLADYADILSSHEVWLAAQADRLEGVLILELRPDDLLLWSIATAPNARGTGLGNRLLAAAEARAQEEPPLCASLYRGEACGQHRLVRASRLSARAD